MSLSTKLSASAKAAAFATAEARAVSAPKSVLSIPTVVRHGAIADFGNADGRKPGAVIRQVGATRRIFALNPHLTSDEMDGLAFRIKMLTRNTSVNSVLLGNNHKTAASTRELTDEELVMPTSDLINDQEETILDDMNFDMGEKVHLAGGYDARSLLDSNQNEKRRTLDALTKLSKAVKGNHNQRDENASNIPFITVSHGLVNDGGYALSMGSYVMATEGSRFRIMNPLRGLSLDPIGYSYILPRLGWEYAQPSADYPVGSIVALTGYEIDGCDMVETGLATHYMGSHRKLAPLEMGLSNMPSYEYQALMPEPIKRYGYENDPAARGRQKDVNARFRNVSVAQFLLNASEYDAMRQNQVPYRPGLAEHFLDEDPSLVLETQKDEYFRERQSNLLDIAATFKEVFEEEKSVIGIMERLEEFSSVEPKDDEEAEYVDAATKLFNGMKAQSPLALLATHHLLKIGRNGKESFSSCIQRETKVQLNLLEGEDFNNWAKSGAKEGEFKDWKHKDVKDVSADEVEELFQ